MRALHRLLLLSSLSLISTKATSYEVSRKPVNALINVVPVALLPSAKELITLNSPYSARHPIKDSLHQALTPHYSQHTKVWTLIY
jgi:hypothetical protein